VVVYSTPTTRGHHGQLAGGPFQFRAEGVHWVQRRPAAFPASLVSWLMEGDDDHTSRADATRCLGQMGPAARPAVLALLRALDSAPGDRDSGHGSTGVGIISVRSAVIEALGRIGDGRALRPLALVLATQPAHARVTLEALQALGPQYPERTRQLIPPAEVAAALRTLDRRSPDYLKQREGVCRDQVAEAALRALAAIRCATCLRSAGPGERQDGPVGCGWMRAERCMRCPSARSWPQPAAGLVPGAGWRA
jgi:hypothetical protein